MNNISQSLLAAAIITGLLVAASLGMAVFAAPFIFAIATAGIYAGVEASLLAYRFIRSRKNRYLILCILGYVVAFVCLFGIGILQVVLHGDLGHYDYGNEISSCLTWSVIFSPMTFASLWWIAAPDTVIAAPKGFPVVLSHGDENN